jgi:hypothetical protein
MPVRLTSWTISIGTRVEKGRNSNVHCCKYGHDCWQKNFKVPFEIAQFISFVLLGKGNNSI